MSLRTILGKRGTQIGTALAKRKTDEVLRKAEEVLLAAPSWAKRRKIEVYTPVRAPLDTMLALLTAEDMETPSGPRGYQI
jgi:hypothetical protein